VWAEIRGAQQRGYRADRVASPKDPLSGLLEQFSHVLVRPDARFSQMPGPTLGLIGQGIRKSLMRSTPFATGRQLDDGGRDQRMPEVKPAQALIDANEAGVLCRREVVEVQLLRGRRQDTEIGIAFQCSQQERLARPRREVRDPRSEQRLQSAIERQHSWQRFGRAALRFAHRGGKLK
jgi:hypothetical protein